MIDQREVVKLWVFINHLAELEMPDLCSGASSQSGIFPLLESFI